MDKAKAKSKFLGDAEAVFERMWSWGAEHSQAALDEIAAELVPLRQEMMGELLGELAQQHVDGWYEEVVCPECGEKMKSSGRRRRKVLHSEGEVEIKRGYHRCLQCGQGIFPPGLKAPPDAALFDASGDSASAANECRDTFLWAGCGPV